MRDGDRDDPTCYLIDTNNIIANIYFNTKNINFIYRKPHYLSN